MSHLVRKNRDNSSNYLSPETENAIKEEISFLKEHLENLQAKLNTKEEYIPLSIFSNDKLSSLENITKFLKENRGKNFSQIGQLLSRDPRTIWTTYEKAKKKLRTPFKNVSSKENIPISVLKDRSLGVLESICLYLKDSLHFSLHEIALALKRSDKTIWTSYHKAKQKKQVHKNE